MWNLLALMWNLDPKPSCGTFTRESLCEVFPQQLEKLGILPIKRRGGLGEALPLLKVEVPPGST